MSNKAIPDFWLTCTLTALFGLLTNATAALNTLDEPPRLNMNVYFEPQDPASTDFLRSQLLPFLETDIAPRVMLKLVPFGRATCDASHQVYECNCPHGPNECDLMHLMSCTLHDYRHHEDAAALIACIQDQPGFEKAYSECVKRLPDKESDWLFRCPQEFRGQYLSWMNGLRTKAVGFELPTMPVVSLNGEIDARTPQTLREQVCIRLSEPKPMGCFSP